MGNVYGLGGTINVQLFCKCIHEEGCKRHEDKNILEKKKCPYVFRISIHLYGSVLEFSKWYDLKSCFFIEM